MRPSQRRFLIPVIAVLLFAGVFTTIFLVLRDRRPDPENLVRNCVERMRRLETVRAHYLLDASPESDSAISGAFMTVEGDASIDLAQEAIDITTTGFMGFQVGMRYVDEALFVKIGRSWYSQPESMLAKLGFTGLKESLPALGSVFELMTFVKDPRLVGLEQVGGVLCDRVSMGLDYTELVESDRLMPLLEVFLSSAGAVSEALENSHLGIEAWIARDTGLLAKAELTFEVAMPELPGLEIFLPSGATSFSVTASFSDYDLPVDIEAPQGARPLTSQALPI